MGSEITAKQQLCTCITLFSTFLRRRCATTTWKCLISRSVENVNARRLQFSFSELWYSPLELNYRKIRTHLTNWTRWNKFEAARIRFLSGVFVKLPNVTTSTLLHWSLRICCCRRIESDLRSSNLEQFENVWKWCQEHDKTMKSPAISTPILNYR